MSRKTREESATYTPLLQRSRIDLGDDQLDPQSPHDNVSPLALIRRRRYEHLVILILALTNVIAFLAFLGLWMDRKPYVQPAAEQLLYSPANHFIEHQVVAFHSGFSGDTTKYMGPPSPELDKEWDDLYQFGLSKISKDEAKLLPWKTVRIPGDPSHSAVALDVFHQLHCLNSIRKAFHPEYYSPHEETHTAHCIDHLRQSIMCASDVSTIVWQWFPDRNVTLGRANTPHTCRNFDKITEWAKDPKHRLRIADFDLTVRPPDDD